LLDRVDRGNVGELSEANSEAVGRGGSPISPGLRRDARR
jgi:hypothetical protein